MGRPLNKKYFGNRNVGGEGGQGLASVTVGGTNDNYTTFPSVTVGASDSDTAVDALASVTSMSVGAVLAITAGGTGYEVGDTLTLVGGTGTVGTLNVDTEAGNVITGASIVTGGTYTALPGDVVNVAVTGGTGNDDAVFSLTFTIDGITIDEAGGGYTGVPTVTEDEGGNATLTGVLTTGNEPSIVMTAFIAGGTGDDADIVAQTGESRYRVTTSDGIGEVYLEGVAAGSIAEGRANITAVDSAGGTYFVTKLTSHVCHVVAGTGVQWATGDKVPWTLDAAVLDVSVQIPSQ
jgi:hypothetical protein